MGRILVSVIEFVGVNSEDLKLHSLYNLTFLSNHIRIYILLFIT